MKNLIKKFGTTLLGLALVFGAGSLASNLFAKDRAEVFAANGDQHQISSFTGKDTGVLINDGATPSAITISDPGYMVKQVIIGWSHNKSNAGVTASVTVGTTSLGSGKVGGTSGSYTTTIGDGSTSASGEINITWSSTLSGSKKGTLYVNSITLVEGGTIIPVDLTDISLPSTGTVSVGSTLSLNPTLTPSDANNKTTFTWESSDEAVATVDSKGVVTGVSTGTAVISLTATDISKTVTCTITVNNHGKEIADPLTVTECIEKMASSSGNVTELWYITGQVTDTPYSTKYGNFYLTDGTSTITIYGCTDSDSALASSSGKYTFTNPQNFASGTLTSTIAKGSVIVMKARLYDYTKSGNTVHEADGVCLSVSNENATYFGAYFLNETTKVCDATTDNLTALQGIWATLKSKFDVLPADEKAKITESSSNSDISDSVARYKYICGKYNTSSEKNLEEFITGVIVTYNAPNVLLNRSNANNSMVIVILVVAITSVTMLGVLVVTKRRHSLTK